MALVFADLVQETTSTTGTGTLTLTGAVVDYQTFDAIGSGNTTYYRIKSNGDSEVGIGTYTAAGTTLSRDTVLYSTAGGTAKINVISGAVVICTYPAEKTVIQDASGNVGIGTPTPTAKLEVTGDAIINGLTVGKGAGSVATNTAVGSSALIVNTTGHNNSAVGVGALQSNITNNYNSAFGSGALQSNDGGERNTAVGYQALQLNTTGVRNAAVGNWALNQNTTGSYNSAMGGNSLLYNTTGFDNSASGFGALYVNVDGYSNSALGSSALNHNTSGHGNSAVGFGALSSNTTGDGNTALGSNSGWEITTGSNNVVIGGYTGFATPISETGSNFVVLSDGSGTVRQTYNASGALAFDTAGTSFGTAGQVLQSNGNAAVPTWAAVDAGSLTGATLASNVLASSLTSVGTLSGLTVSGSISASSVALTTGTITTAPSSSSDIVNKSYADSIAAGVNFHAACNYATTVALAANTYANGTGGVNATLTGDVNGAVSVDGTTPLVTQRVLIKNEVAQANNGVYTVTQVGTTLLPYILTRATDYDTSGSGTNEVDQGDMLLIISGPTNANTSWVQQTPLPITIGSTAIVFIQFAAIQTYTAGTGLTLATNQFSITNVGTSGTYGSASLIPVITTNAQGQVTSVTTAANPQGTVTSVIGTAPVVSSGGATPAISMAAAATGVSGYLTSTDWGTFNGKQAALVSTTNIKSINGASILGSGDLTVSASFTGGTLTSPLILAAGTTTNGTEPLRLQSGPVVTSPASGTLEFDGTTMFSTTETGNRGVAPSIHYITQVAIYTTPTGSNNTLKQMFNATTNGAMTSAANVTYFFECMVNISAMSATAGTLQFGFLGTATFSSILYIATANKTALTVQTAVSTTMGTVKTALVITASNTTTTGYAFINGKITVTTAGTIIPAYATSIAAASVVNIGSYFKIWEAGANTELEIGNWT